MDASFIHFEWIDYIYISNNSIFLKLMINISDPTNDIKVRGPAYCEFMQTLERIVGFKRPASSLIAGDWVGSSHNWSARPWILYLYMLSKLITYIVELLELMIRTNDPTRINKSKIQAKILTKLNSVIHIEILTIWCRPSEASSVCQSSITSYFSICIVTLSCSSAVHEYNNITWI